MSDIETGPDRFVICHIAINGQHAHDALDSIENEWTAARERIAELLKIQDKIDKQRDAEIDKRCDAEAERDELRKLAGELVGFIEAHELAHSHEIARRAILESAQKAGIANPCASEPYGGPRPADATIPRP